MKNFFIILLLITVLFVNAQNETFYETAPYLYIYLKVTDSTAKPIPFTEVVLAENKTNAELSSITNANGIASFRSKKGIQYAVKINNQIVTHLEVPSSAMLNLSRTVVFNPPPDFNMLPPDTIAQQIDPNVRPEPGKIYLKVNLLDRENRKIAKVKVRVWDFARKKVYTSITNSMGIAAFMVDRQTKFYIGIEMFDKYATVTTGDYSMGFIVEYEPTKVNETVRGDTIIQQIPSFSRATSMRAVFRIYLFDHDRIPLENEPVYIDVSGSSKVYMAYTDKKGVATLLLPKGSSYLINFMYDRGVKMIDIPAENDYQTINLRCYYIGSHKVQQYYKNYARKHEFRTEFISPRIEPAVFDNSVVEMTKDGFVLNFPNPSPLSPPTVINNDIFISGGYHTPEFYCLDRLSAKPKWAVRLSESGICSAVYSEGIILVISESCTLYAIDAETGILAWSKWLGPNIYTTPSVAHGKVFTVYPNELENYYVDSNFVLVAFELKTGKIAWQNWLSDDINAVPVIHGNDIYVSDLRGKLYRFDAITGVRKAMVSAAVLTPPTISGDYLVTMVRSFGKVKPVIWQSDNLKMISSLDEITDIDQPYISSRLPWASRMNFNAGRALITEKTAFLSCGKILYAIDLTTSQVKWKVEAGQPAQLAMPQYLNKTIILPVEDRKVIFLNETNGTITKTIPLAAQTFSDVIFYKGWIYYSTTDGKVYAVNLSGKIDGIWTNWSMNANHNPAF